MLEREGKHEHVCVYAFPSSIYVIFFALVQNMVYILEYGKNMAPNRALRYKVSDFAKSGGVRPSGWRKKFARSGGGTSVRRERVDLSNDMTWRQMIAVGVRRVVLDWGVSLW